MTVTSLEEIKNAGPGTYDIEYNKFYFHVTVGNIDENASINLDGYGSEVSSDGKIVDNYLSNYDQNSIDIRFQYGHDGYAYNGWDGAISGFMSEVSKTFGLNLDNSMISGFSSTAGKTVHLVSQYVEDNDVNNSYAVIIESVRDQKLSDEERQRLIDHNTTIVNAYTRDHCSLENYSSSYEGVHMIDLEFNVFRNGVDVSSDSHAIVHDILVDYGITNIGNGGFDFTSLPSEYTFRGGQTYAITYDIVEHYYDENGNYVSRVLTQEEANEVIRYNSFRLTQEDIIQSDNEYLSKSLSIINSMIRKSQLDGLSTEGYGSTTNVPSKEPTILFKMIASNIQILEKLGKEMAMIGAVGDKFVEMDNFLSEEASTLGMEVTSELLPEVEVIDYESRTTDGLVPLNLLQELEKLKNQIENNSEDNPFVEEEKQEDSREVQSYSIDSLYNKDLCDSVCEITAEDLERLFAHWAEQTGNTASPLIGTGEYFIEAAEETGLDVMTLIGICGFETGRGSPKKGNWIYNDNFLGLRYTYDKDGKSVFYGGTNHLYDSKEESIIAGAQRIKKFYYDEWGATSFKGLAAIHGYDGASGTGIEYPTMIKESLDYILSTSGQEIVVPSTPTGIQVSAPVSTPSTPASTPSTPVSTPSTPVSTPSTPVSTPSTPVSTPSTPASTPSTLVSTPSTPASTPSTPVSTPSIPTNTPSTPVSTPSTPTSTPSTPVSTPSNEPKITSDDSYREIIEQDLEEIIPRVSDKKQKTPIVPSKPSSSTAPSVPVEPTPPSEVEIKPEIEVPVEPIIPEEPVIDPEIEVPVEPIIPSEPIMPDEPIEVPTNHENILKTIGITAGIGVGLGTVAYGVNNQINKKILRDGFEYTYEQEETRGDYLEQETLEEQYSPYIKNQMYIEDEPYKARKEEIEDGGDE